MPFLSPWSCVSCRPGMEVLACPHPLDSVSLPAFRQVQEERPHAEFHPGRIAAAPQRPPYGRRGQNVLPHVFVLLRYSAAWAEPTTAVLQQHYYLYYQSCAAHNPRVARAEPTTAVLQQHYYFYYQSCAAHNPRVARWLACTMVYYGEGLCRKKRGLNGAF